MISSTKEIDALFGEIGKELNKKVTLYMFGGADGRREEVDEYIRKNLKGL